MGLNKKCNPSYWNFFVVRIDENKIFLQKAIMKKKTGGWIDTIRSMRVHLLQIRLLYLGSSRPENKNTNKNVNLDFSTQVKVARSHLKR
jgi:hypothetical protein